MRDTLNKGVARSRNLRIGKTRGKYIATLDADDYGEPKKLTQQIALMEAHPELGMVRGTVRWASGRTCSFRLAVELCGHWSIGGFQEKFVGPSRVDEDHFSRALP